MTKIEMEMIDVMGKMNMELEHLRRLAGKTKFINYRDVITKFYYDLGGSDEPETKEEGPTITIEKRDTSFLHK